jgi:hypothetical protein
MKKCFGIITAALLTTSIYSQAYEKPPSDSGDLSGVSSSPAQNDDDYRSRQTEAGAPGSSEQDQSSGYERSSGTSNSSTGFSNGENKSNPPDDTDYSTGPSTSTTYDSSTGDSSSNSSSTSTSTSTSEPNLSNAGSAAESEWDLSGGDSELRGDLNSQFDRSNNSYPSLDEPDMIYEEWIVVEPSLPDVGAPAQSESGFGNSDERYDNNFDTLNRSDVTGSENSGQQVDPSDARGTDIPASGAPGSSVSGSERSDQFPECFPDAEGTAPDYESGYSDDGDPSINSGISDTDDDRYHLNRGNDSKYHINRSENRDYPSQESLDRVGAPPDSGERSSESSNSSDWSDRLNTESSRRSSGENTRPPDL